MEVFNYNEFGTKISFVESISQILENLPTKCVVITDENVEKLYGHYFENYRKIVIKAGERSKSFGTIQLIIKELLNYNVGREIYMIGLGGGVVCDITGFVASIYKRGVKHIFIPTTLLAQIDAAIGGKNGINFEEIKNVIGTFKHPENISISIEFLETLSGNEIQNGIAELIKIAVIKDEELFDEISQLIRESRPDYTKICNLGIIEKAIRYKMEIVSEDFRETGIRKILNFGHTFGHSIEMINKVTHGRAVLEGMKIVLKLSEYQSGLDKEISAKIRNIIEQIAGADLKFDKSKIFEKIYNDKKAFGDEIDLILLKDIAQPIIYTMKLEKLKEMYYDLC